MNPTLALVACTAFVGALLIMERRSSQGVSLAVWLPTAWLMYAGSRPIASWFGTTSSAVEGGAEAGSPLDRLVLSLLIALAVAVIAGRRIEWRRLTGKNLWLLVLFLYMAASVLWSEFPLVSSKRWFRALGPLLMGVTIISERNPLDAFKAVFRRTVYILVPFSLLLIKYYPTFGVQFSRWTGERMWTGVAMQKNGLGQLCAMAVLLLTWANVTAWRSRTPDGGRARMIADLAVVGIALFLLRGPGGSYSATSIAVLAAAEAALLVLYAARSIGHGVVRHLEALTLLMVVGYWLVAEWIAAPILSALGRDPTLTGRREIWSTLLEIAARHPILGTGYGGFWGLHPEIMEQLQVGQSHNGYLGVYLELGVVGIILLSVFVLSFCGNIRRVFDESLDTCALAVGCLVAILLYDISESAFLTDSGFIWVATVCVAVLVSYHQSGSASVSVRPALKTASVRDGRVATRSSGRRSLARCDHGQVTVNTRRPGVGRSSRM